MSDNMVRNLPAQFERIASKSIGPKIINAFLHTHHTIVSHCNVVCHLRSQGYIPVFSLDLCDLLDRAFTTFQRFSQVREHPKFTQWRTLQDVTFSRMAIESLVKGQSHYTLLPAAMAEILLFLSIKHSDIAYLKVKTQGIEKAFKDLSQPNNIRERESAYRRLIRTNTEIVEKIEVADRLIELVNNLLRNKSYIEAKEFFQIEDVPIKIITNYQNAMDAVRPDKIGTFSNTADSLSLGFCEYFNTPKVCGDSKYVLIHLTRTSSIHRLTGAELSLTVFQPRAGLEVPIIVHPQVPCLIEKMFPGQWQADALFDAAQEFQKFWNDLALILQKLSREIKRGYDYRRLSPILKQLESIENAHQGIANNFRDYINIFLRNTAYFEQVVHHETKFGSKEYNRYKKRMRKLIDMSNLIKQQEKLLAVHEVLSTNYMFDRAKRKIRELEEQQIGYRITEAEQMGYLLTRRGASQSKPWDEFELKTPKSKQIVLGMQIKSINGHNRITVFWPYVRSPLEFLRLISKAIEKGAENKNTELITVGEEESYPEFHTFPAKMLRENHKIIRKLGNIPLEVIQVRLGNEVYTCEFKARDRPAYFSMRFEGNLSSKLSLVYDERSSVLCTASVCKFVTTILNEKEENKSINHVQQR